MVRVEQRGWVVLATTHRYQYRSGIYIAKGNLAAKKGLRSLFWFYTTVPNDLPLLRQVAGPVVETRIRQSLFYRFVNE